MTTPTGVAHLVGRLSSCPNLAALRKVWEGIHPDYQRHPDIMALKEKMKETLK